MLLLFKNILFTILAPGAVAVYIPLWIAPPGSDLFTPGWGLGKLTAALLLLSGVAIYLRCLWDFAVYGQGTPAPIDAPKRLVARGLYRYVRNPMYVGVLTAIFAWALLFSSLGILVYGMAVGLLFHLFVVLVEEPSLRKKFGESYVRYCKEVNRWAPTFRQRRIRS
jgi:protein-S-isoprenylcysteine O-methyltransferase Ste14